jgi:hypothetical protein
MGGGQGIYYTAPGTGPPPANETIVTSGVGAKGNRQIAPRRAGSQDSEDAVEDTTVVHPWHATRLVRQHRLDGSPLSVGEFVPHDSAPSGQGLESRLGRQLQRDAPPTAGRDALESGRIMLRLSSSAYDPKLKSATWAGAPLPHARTHHR